MPANDTSQSPAARTGFAIRRARADDAASLLEVQQVAITAISSQSYGRRELDAWLSGLTHAALSERIVTREVFVATLDTPGTGRAVVGFAELLLPQSEVSAIFVRPEAQGTGVGRALISTLEACACDHQLHILQVHAAKNALGFYREAGFTEQRQVQVQVRGGLTLEAHLLFKHLSPRETRMVTALTSERLRLREYRSADLANAQRMFADPQALRFYPRMRHPDCVADWIERSILKYRREGFGLWAVERLDTGEFVGDCGLIWQKIDQEPLLEVGYHLCESARGFGFATEAAAACQQWAFEDLGVRHLISLVHLENGPSRAVARRVHDTLYRERYVFRGEPHEVYISQAVPTR